jgi:hypothetical protein
MANQERYFVHKKKETVGPFSKAQIQEKIDSCQLSRNDLIWFEGAQDWKPIYTISEFSFAHVPPPVNKGPTGVGGWLLFFCISLTILRPVFIFVRMSVAWDKAQPAFQQFPSLESALTFENFGSAALGVYGLFVGSAIWNGDSRGKRLAIQFLIVQFSGLVVIELLTLAMLPSMSPAISNAAISQGVLGVVWNGVGNFLWLLYFKFSKRVRNTYDDVGAPTKHVKWLRL